MSVTILETLQNAKYNLDNVGTGKIQTIFLGIAKEQLNNAVILLEKGYGIYATVDDLIREYSSVEEVPENDK